LILTGAVSLYIGSFIDPSHVRYMELMAALLLVACNRHHIWDVVRRVAFLLRQKGHPARRP
jgi:hypothetical protein